ncbi:MAG TPA: heme-binding protein [Bryobacteraceae bacterium]|nr:heme-binding protein [Bryobacteraceae bacterium]
MKPILTGLQFIAAAGFLASGVLFADGPGFGSACNGLPSYGALKAALKSVAPGGSNSVNGGLNDNMWATVVNRDGIVCAVVFTGADRGSQWPGSRVISAQKANTANAFSLPGLALSTANLWAPTQPGGSLYGLQHSNPVDTGVAYGGNSNNIGQPNDPMVGQKIGGVNVFGGGLALYNKFGVLVGGLGVSGDTSCTDHIVAWKTRHALNFDNVPAGVADGGKDDNMINDLAPLAPGETTAPSAGGFGHPTCDATAAAINATLPVNFPVGPNP